MKSYILLLLFFMCSPGFVMAGFDDIESEVEKMEGTSMEPEVEMHTPPPKQIIKVPQKEVAPAKVVTHTPAKPRKPDIGIGFKIGSGSGTWENKIDGSTVSSGDFDLSTQSLAFYFINGALEFDIGTGSFTYPSGSSRDFTELTFQGNIGRGISDKNSGVSPYLSLGMSYYLVDYSDTTDYYGNSNPPAFEWYALIGGGVSFRYDEFEFFAEYILSTALLSTGRESSSNQYDTIETFHDNNRFAIGAAAYF